MQSNTCIAYYEIFCEISFFSLQIYPKTLFQKNLNTASIPRNERKPVALLFFCRDKKTFCQFCQVAKRQSKDKSFYNSCKISFFHYDSK